MRAVRQGGRARPTLLATVAITAVSVAACTGTGRAASEADGSPTTTLHQAIATLEDQASYELAEVVNPPGLSPAAATYNVRIEAPDKIAIAGSRTVIAIGSTGYLRNPGGWTTVHHSGESAQFVNDMLMFVNILKRATSVRRAGTTYFVPTGEASELLASTGLPWLQGESDVSYSAVVRGGLIVAVSLLTGGSAPLTATIDVSHVGSAPPISAPTSASA